MPTEKEMFLANAQRPLPQQHYLASPYAAKSAEASADYAEAARQAGVVLRQQGYIVYCPLLAGSQQLPSGWYHYDLGHLRDCRGGMFVLTLPGWQKSHGIQLEIAAALVLERPIKMLDPKDFVDAELLSRINSRHHLPQRVTIKEDGVATIMSTDGETMTTQAVREAFVAGQSPLSLASRNKLELDSVFDALRYEMG